MSKDQEVQAVRVANSLTSSTGEVETETAKVGVPLLLTDRLNATSIPKRRGRRVA
jgi:hypothetical protein